MDADDHLLFDRWSCRRYDSDRLFLARREEGHMIAALLIGFAAGFGIAIGVLGLILIVILANGMSR